MSIWLQQIEFLQKLYKAVFREKKILKGFGKLEMLVVIDIVIWGQADD